MKYFTAEEAREFAGKWLPAWTGNNPDLLAGFYSDDAFYLDPAIPQGIRGKEALVKYFTKLLSFNPDWIWTQIEGIPLKDGFLNKWLAKIPAGDKVLEIVGVCFVQINEEGKIYRNEVYFDRSPLLAELSKQKNR